MAGGTELWVAGRRAWALSAALLAVILWKGLEPAPEPVGELGDKSLHVLAFAAIGWSLGRALWAAPLRAGLILALLALGLETLQASMGWGRQGEPVDWFASSLGAAFGVVLARQTEPAETLGGGLAILALSVALQAALGRLLA